MNPTESFATYWWFHIPNLIMAALIYSLIARYALELILTKNQDAVLLKVFRSVTDPIVNLVRLITPRVVPDGLVVVFAICWLFAGRMLWFLLAVVFGMQLGTGA